MPTRPVEIGVCVVLLSVVGAGCGSGGGAADAAPAASHGINVTTGALPLYHLYLGKPRNDASGVVFLPTDKRILVVDDGGDDASPDVVPFYLFHAAELFAPMPKVTELPPLYDAPGSVAGRHLDTEAVTFDGKYVYVASSMPSDQETGKDKPQYRALSRFKVAGGKISDDASIDPRDAIMEALRSWSAAGSDPGWYGRVSGAKQKDGNLNIEAMSFTPKPNELLLGLRSPHEGVDYMKPPDGGSDALATRIGQAILVKINVTEFDAGKLSPTVHTTLDLGGLGFRSLEYSPTARGYFLTAGIVDAGWDYDFFFWNGQPGEAPVRLKDKIKEFDQLCRPEGVTEIEKDGRHYLMVLSEDSGALCEMPPAPFNYLLIELNHDFLKLLQ